MDTSIVASSDYCKCSALLNPARLVFNLKTDTVTVSCDACGEISIVGNIEKKRLLLPPPCVVMKPAKKQVSNAVEGDVLLRPNKCTEKTEEKYRCTHCSKTFNLESVLKEHVLVAHSTLDKEKEEEFHKNCTQNLQSENSSVALTGLDYCKTDVREKQFKCSFCEFTSNQKSYVIKHERFHNGKKPFVCQYCEKKFRWKNVLDHHVRTHMGDDPFVCKICEKSFASNQLYKKHKEKIHAKKLRI